MSDDAFSVLGLPRRFELDRAALQRAYLRMSAALHPDRMSDPIAQAEASAAAAGLNDARAILADDERRANELLRLLGGPTKEQDDSLPDGFLMEIMDARQDMEQAIASGEPAERARVEQWAKEQREQCVSTVAEMFTRAESDSSNELLREVRTTLNAWRYIERMIEQLDPEYQREL